MSNDNPYVSRLEDEQALCAELGLSIPERVMSIDSTVRPRNLVTATVKMTVPTYLAKRLFAGDLPSTPVTPATMTDEDARRIEFERRPDYWAKDLNVTRGFYNFDRVVYRYYQDGAPPVTGDLCGD